MAKIAVGDSPNGTQRSRLIARGSGWSVQEERCGSGPQDRPFEEQHARYSVSLVLEGTFQYRSRLGRQVMIPGSVLLGNAEQYFECSHEHGVGDHCVSFQYSREYLDSLTRSVQGPDLMFSSCRIAPSRSLSPLFSRVQAGVLRNESFEWDDIGLQLASTALTLGLPRSFAEHTPAAEARVTKVVRLIESNPVSALDLATLAREARLSPYHFLRVFQQLTLLTPHQYILRTRLLRAAMRLALDGSNIIEIAGDCGFGDVSNFNRAFRAEFGVSPRQYRRASR